MIPADASKPIEVQDEEDNRNMMDVLEDKIIPLYYENQDKWLTIMKNSMRDVNPQFDSGRMVHEYYVKLYNYENK
jgi:starch phosphorylase